MKYLAAIALLGSVSVYGQNFSPSASGSSIASPSGSVGAGSSTSITPGSGTPTSLSPGGAGTTLNPVTPSSTYYNSPVDTGSIPNTNFNTAPTNVPTGQPSDTTLLNNGVNNSIPSNNPIQAQEYDNSAFGSGTGSGSGVNPGTGFDGTSPITNP